MIEFVRLCPIPGCGQDETISTWGGWMCQKHYNEHIAAEFRWEAGYLEESNPRRKECLEAAREWENRNEHL